MRQNQKFLQTIPAIFLFAASAFAQESNPAQTPQKPAISFPKAVESKASGTMLYSLYDQNSPTLKELNNGELLIAHSEKAGWYEVEVPASFPCWIFGKYIKEGEELGTATITDERVNVRALPSSDKNYPIGKLGKGLSLRVMDHKAEWVQIQAPASLHAWVKADAVNLLGEPAQYQDRIAAHQKDAQSQWQSRLDLLAKQKEEEKKRVEAKMAFDRAEAALVGEQKRAVNADFTQVKALFGEAEAKAIDASMKDQVKSKLDLIAALENLQKEKANAATLEQKAKDMEEKLGRAKEDAIKDADARIRFSDPDKLKGRYESMGWLKRSLSITKGNYYSLEKGGITICEIRCSTGRYNLTDFLGREIGVNGAVTRDANGVKTIDINKIEVLANPER